MLGSRLFVHLLRDSLGASSATLRVSLSLILLVACSCPLASQDRLLPVFHFNRLSTADGLPSNEVRSNIVTDRQGFVWIGTVNGLARYDGYTCKVYRNNPDDPSSISSNGIMPLLIESRGLLWVGTFDTGFSIYDAANDRFVNFLPRGKDNTLLGLKAIQNRSMKKPPQHKTKEKTNAEIGPTMGQVPAYDARFDASKLASGVYVYRLAAGDVVQSKTFVLLK